MLNSRDPEFALVAGSATLGVFKRLGKLEVLLPKTHPVTLPEHDKHSHDNRFVDDLH